MAPTSREVYGVADPLATPQLVSPTCDAPPETPRWVCLPWSRERSFFFCPDHADELRRIEAVQGERTAAADRVAALARASYLAEQPPIEDMLGWSPPFVGPG